MTAVAGLAVVPAVAASWEEVDLASSAAAPDAPDAPAAAETERRLVLKSEQLLEAVTLIAAAFGSSCVGVGVGVGVGGDGGCISGVISTAAASVSPAAADLFLPTSPSRILVSQPGQAESQLMLPPASLLEMRERGDST